MAHVKSLVDLQPSPIAPSLPPRCTLSLRNSCRPPCRTLPFFAGMKHSPLSRSPASISAVENELSVEFGGGGNDIRDGSHHGHGGGGGGWDGDNGESGDGESKKTDEIGLLASFLSGWRARVKADPQFPFKVLMEEVVGVGACVIGDMASRPNFGLNELDFVFSTVVVGSILNFTLMYMLAPTGSASSCLPGIFSSCPSGHMFETGSYTMFERFGTFLYKGLVFGTVGFGAGFVGTFTSNLLLNARKKMDPGFVQQNKAPPTMLNAATWAIHMGLSSNLRYQALNGLEFELAKFLSPPVFRASVLVTRTLNNILGGISFVTLARLTGSQKIEKESPSPPSAENQEALQPSKA